MKTSNKILLGAFVTAWLALAVFLTSFSANLRTLKPIVGNGNFQSNTKEVPDFSKIINYTFFKIVLTQGEKSIRVDADENVQKLLLFNVEDNSLNIKLDGDFKDGVQSQKEFIIYVQTPNIELIQQNNNGSIRADSLLTSASLKIIAKDAGSIHLSKVEVQNLHADTKDAAFTYIAGKTQNLDAKAKDAARIHAENLQTTNTNFNCSDSGHLRVKALQTLNGTASDAASVTFSGDPQTRINTRDAASVSKTNR